MPQSALWRLVRRTHDEPRVLAGGPQRLTIAAKPLFTLVECKSTRALAHSPTSAPAPLIRNLTPITHILEPAFSAAIRERRVLSILYVGAVQPQFFAPLALYVTAADAVMVDGYEVTHKHVRWRELELAAVRDARQTARTFSFREDKGAIRKIYSPGTRVIAQAMLLPR